MIKQIEKVKFTHKFVADPRGNACIGNLNSTMTTSPTDSLQGQRGKTNVRPRGGL